MRMMMKVGLDTELANEAAREGTLSSTIKSILDDLKPEAAYFVAANGRRTGVVVFDLQDESDIPSVAEPWFLAFGAHIEATPAMTVEDLGRADMESPVEKYG